MALLTPMWMQPVAGDADITYSAAEDRAGLLGAMFSREGVLDKDAGQLKVSQRSEGANFSVDVAAGRCAIVGDDVSDQGTYLCTSTTKVNLTLPGKPASGSRTHRIVAQVRDKLANGVHTTYRWTLDVLEDTGSGTPATPNSAISLATVTVASTASSVLNANIAEGTGDRKRASIGTPWLTGNLLESNIHAVYSGRDGTRPLTYQKSPDGFVTLSGFIRRTGATSTIGAGVMTPFNGIAPAGTGNPIVPAEACPTGIRDVTMMTDLGPCNLAIFPNGVCTYRFQPSVTVVQNQTWWSFDGCTYRSNAFS